MRQFILQAVLTGTRDAWILLIEYFWDFLGTADALDTIKRKSPICRRVPSSQILSQRSLWQYWIYWGKQLGLYCSSPLEATSLTDNFLNQEAMRKPEQFWNAILWATCPLEQTLKSTKPLWKQRRSTEGLKVKQKPNKICMPYFWHAFNGQYILKLLRCEASSALQSSYSGAGQFENPVYLLQLPISKQCNALALAHSTILCFKLWSTPVFQIKSNSLAKTHLHCWQAPWNWESRTTASLLRVYIAKIEGSILDIYSQRDTLFSKFYSSFPGSGEGTSCRGIGLLKLVLLSKVEPKLASISAASTMTSSRLFTIGSPFAAWKVIWLSTCKKRQQKIWKQY